jgi:hypothetical protein
MFTLVIMPIPKLISLGVVRVVQGFALVAVLFVQLPNRSMVGHGRPARSRRRKHGCQRR